MTVSYRVKVLAPVPGRRWTALFGGAGILEPLRSGLTLLVQLDRTAAPVSLYAKTVDGDDDQRIGELAPGETFAVPLTQVYYVAATAEEDTFVECTILDGAAVTESRR